MNNYDSISISTTVLCRLTHEGFFFKLFINQKLSCLPLYQLNLSLKETDVGLPWTTLYTLMLLFHSISVCILVLMLQWILKSNFLNTFSNKVLKNLCHSSNFISTHASSFHSRINLFFKLMFFSRLILDIPVYSKLEDFLVQISWWILTTRQICSVRKNT